MLDIVAWRKLRIVELISAARISDAGNPRAGIGRAHSLAWQVADGDQVAVRILC